jgi:signal transduction histidine kinase
VIASPETTAGPYVVSGPLWGEESMPMMADVSMTPVFIAGLGPEHAAGLSTTLVMALVAANALLVVVGVWQFRRERELARLRSDFVAGVSHELRTPLAQIRMFSETLLLDRVRNAEERRRALEIIGQESTRLGQLVDNILLFYRRRRQDAKEASETIDFKAFAGDVVESFKPLAASRRAEITFAFSAADATVEGDAGGLRQVLLNLLDNAVKFGPPGQTIAVQVATSGDSVVLTVDDAGPGVEAAERKRIFEAFERGRQTSGTGGAGIGLAVIRQIVLAHGGDVAVGAAPLGGARFTVTLPLAARS